MFRSQLDLPKQTKNKLVLVLQLFPAPWLQAPSSEKHRRLLPQQGQLLQNPGRPGHIAELLSQF